MLYVQAEMGVFVALLATIYFPPSPPTPPSLSAGAERINFKSSLKALLHNRAFLILAVSGGIASGANLYVLALSAFIIIYVLSCPRSAEKMRIGAGNAPFSFPLGGTLACPDKVLLGVFHRLLC